jgi:hypothetical protein
MRLKRLLAEQDLDLVVSALGPTSVPVILQVSSYSAAEWIPRS